MNIVDYVLIAVIVISAVVGLLRGFLREVISVLAWLVALFAAWRFGAMVEPYLGGLLAGSQVRPWAARTIVFLVVLLLGAAVGAILGHFMRISIFSGMDRFLGLLFGVMRGVVVIGVLVMLGHLLQLTGEPWWTTSKLIPYGEEIANVLRVLVGEELTARESGLTTLAS